MHFTPLLPLLLSGAMARNYFVEVGVTYAASELAQYHASGVESADASAMASELIGQYVDEPPISTALSKAIAYAERQAVMNFGRPATTVDFSAAQSMLSDYAAAFTEFSHGSDWASFSAKVRKHKSSYDVTKMVVAMRDQAQKPQTAAGFNNFKQQIDQFKTMPEGKQLISSAKQLYDAHNTGLGLGLPPFVNMFNLI